MATGDLKIRAIIETILKEKGLTATKKGLKETKKAAKETSQSFQDMDRIAGKLKAQLAATFGAAVIGRLVQDSILQFSLYERRLSAVVRQAGSLGIATEGMAKRTDDFLASMERTTGVLRQDALPAFNKFLGITESFDGAMFATKLTIDLTNAGMGEMKTNAERLANLLQGEVTEAAKALGLALRDDNGVIKTQRILLDELTNKWFGFSEQQDDSQAKIETIQARFNTLKATFQEEFGPAILNVGKFLASIPALLKVVAPALEAFFVALFVGARDSISGIAAVVNEFLKGGFFFAGGGEKIASEFNSRLLTLKANFLNTFRDAGREIKGIFEGIGKDSADAFARGQEINQKIADAKQRGFDKKKADKAVADAIVRQKKIDDANRRGDDALLAARLVTTEQGTVERLVLELEMLDRQKDAAIAAQKEIGASTASITEAFRIAEQSKRDDFFKAQVEKEKDSELKRIESTQRAQSDLLSTQIAGLEAGDERRLELRLEQLKIQEEIELARAEELEQGKFDIQEKFREKRSQAEKENQEALQAIADEERERNLANAQSFADQAVATFGAIFGESKGTAIAQAIISTFIAANKALELGPIIGPPLAALMIAQGLANVARIRKTEPGGQGFDDPESDRLARIGTRRWAKDFLRNVGFGFSDTLRDSFQVAKGDSNVTNNSRNMNLSIGVLVGEGGLRQLKRKLDKIETRDVSRLIR